MWGEKGLGRGRLHNPWSLARTECSPLSSLVLGWLSREVARWLLCALRVLHFWRFHGS